MAFRGDITRYLHYAVHIIGVAAFNLNLDGAMTNSKIVL
jgi:hypothetical protein